MNDETLSPRAQALIRELTRYVRKYGNDCDRSHVEHLEAELQAQTECDVNTLQRQRAAQARAHRTGS